MPITTGRRKSKRKSLVINRGSWLVPENFHSPGERNSCLFDPKTKMMCCLGFWERDILGTPRKQLENMPMPFELGARHDRMWHVDAAYLNDIIYPTGKEREEKLIELFRKRGRIDLTFIGRYRKR